MRYRGQAYNLTVPLAPAGDRGLGRGGRRGFEEQHRLLYDYTPTVTDTDIVTLRLRRSRRSPTSTGSRRGRPSGRRRRPADLERRRSEAGSTTTRAALAVGARVEPETIIEQEDTTVVVPAGWSGAIGAGGTLVLEREDA